MGAYKWDFTQAVTAESIMAFNKKVTSTQHFHRELMRWCDQSAAAAKAPKPTKSESPRTRSTSKDK